ncbi:ParB/RepB/Spo0J family partition protein [uncultured Helicobacter sp.]|uniref:ParB/RepB/Spo0J family partition protein n=1 Tax=uncultured Helicobacter sp. TaxID=175537 RepID=UPI00374E35B0
MAKKNRGLGRGLGEIFSEVSQAYENSMRGSNDAVLELSVEVIKPNPYQPRKYFEEGALRELADSIKEHGLLQPIVVCEDEDGEYVLLAGERRLRASKMAGLANIKAIVADIDLHKMRELALIENIQRADLNPIELAYSYQELIDEYDITHEELSQKIKKSRTQITNTLRLLSLEAFVQESLIEGKITQGHAKILVTLSPQEQRLAVDSIIGQKLSVRDSEALIKNIKNSNTPSNQAPKKSQSYGSIDTQLLQEAQKILRQDAYKVNIKNNQLCIEFSQDVEIRAFIEKISQ